VADTVLEIPLGNDVVVPFGPDPADAPVDISGWTIRFQVRKRHDSTDYLITKQTGGGGVAVVNGPVGDFEVTLASTDTAAYTAGDYFFCAERIDPGHRTLLDSGVLRLLPPRHVA
jgi:hypothetical protein